MTTLKLVFSELRHRPFSALLTLLIIATATSAVVFFVGVSEIAADRTRVIQRDIGLNVRVIPEGTNLERYWLNGYAEGSIDDAIVDKLEAQDVANRLVPMLQRTVPWGDGEAVLTGIGTERFQRGNKKKPVFGGTIDDPHRLDIGSVAAEMRELQEGDEIELLGQSFTIKRILASTGSIDDIRVFADLATVQTLLNMQGRINEIRAIECHCDESVKDPEEYLKQTLEPLLPGTMVIRQDREADARRKQRLLADRVGAVASPILVVLSVCGVFALAMLNSQQRRLEIGLLATIGQSAFSIGALVWIRAALLGVLGGLAGAWIGMALLSQYGGELVGAAKVPDFDTTNWFIGGGLGGILASLGALIPAVLASRSDPASILQEVQ